MHRLNFQDKILTHVYVRDFQKCVVRPCWASRDVIFCGICMRGTVQPVEGSECRYCNSTVDRVLIREYRSTERHESLPPSKSL